MKNIFLVAIISFFNSHSFSQPFESFNFTGSANANGWTTHSGTTPGQIQAIATPSNNGNSLSFPALENPLGNRIQLTAGNTEDINKPVSNISGIGYYSFLLNVPTVNGLHANGGAGDYFIGFGGNTGASVTILAGRVHVKTGSTPNFFSLGILNQSGGGSATNYIAGDYVVGSTVFIVVKVDATVSPINVSMWVNPTPGTLETVPNITNNTGSNALANFSSLFIRQGGTATTGTGNVEIDELRVGSTWNQVTPCNAPTTFYSDSDNDGFGNLNSPVISCLSFNGVVQNSLDCDDTNPLLNPNTIWYLDSDNDTYGDLANPFTGCTPPTPGNYVQNSTDCDDTNPNVNAVTTWYLDADNDGFGNFSTTIQNCGQPTGYVSNSTDCNDNNIAVNPNAIEVFDGVDNNCNNVIDEGFTLTTYYEDLDGDNFGSSVSIQSVTNPGAGYSLVSGDCNDNNNLINPNAIEVCDGVDNNCDLNIDENLPTLTYYLDADNDGFGDLNFTIIDCSVPVGYSTNSLDCDDTNNQINPNATEIPGNGIDEDCSGTDAVIVPLILGIYEFTQPSGCPVTATAVTTQPTTATFGTFSSTGVNCQGAGNVYNNNDWNTTTTLDLTEYAEFSITANECQSLDLDRIAFNHRCSATGGTPTWYVRSSLDNYATDLGTGISGNNNNQNLDDTVTLGAAFDAVSNVTFRFYLTGIGATGSTFRLDNVSLYGNTTSITPQTFYADTDNDGFGDLAVDSLSCSIPVGFVLDSTDCNDADSLINPTTVWFLDADLDTFGDATNSVVSCTQPIGYVLNNTDCNDNNNQITGAIMYYVDADGDGFGDDATGVEQCSQPQNTVTISGDCDDTNDQIYPGAIEICDGFDNNCTGGIDEGLTFVTYFIDADNDGFGTGTGESLCSNPGTGFAIVGGDCNDNNDQIYPGAIEILDNSIDENCDGVDGYLSVEDLTLTTFKIVPNPNNGTFVIEMNTVVSNATVTIQDINGKAVQNSIFTGATFEANLSSLTPGIYFVKIKSENTIAIERMVIR